MKTLGYITALITAAAMVSFAASALAGVASQTTSVKGAYTGKATEKVNGQSVSAFAKGTGKVGVVGKSTISGTVKGTTTNPPCSPFGGPGTIKGAKGTLKVTVTKARGCAASEEDQNSITFSGTVKVKGGTGKFAKAKGSFHISGHYDRTGGAFNVKLTGTLTY